MVRGSMPRTGPKNGESSHMIQSWFMIAGGPMRPGGVAGRDGQGAAELKRMSPETRSGWSRAKRMAGVPPADALRTNTRSIPRRSSISAKTVAWSAGEPSPRTALPG